MPKGTVKNVIIEKGFFFIERHDGAQKDLFAHINDFQGEEIPKSGDTVQYELGQNRQGACAVNITLVEEVVYEQPAQHMENVLDYNKKFQEKKSKLQKHSSYLDSIKQGYHFYIVFNPLMNNDYDKELNGITQAHSFNNLLKNKEYLYWGKYKASSNTPDLNLENFQRCLEENTKAGVSTNLFISDFHHFWVAKVESVEKNIDYENEKDHTLEFYRKNRDKIELWFKISDIMLLSSNVENTNKHISKLELRTTNSLNAIEVPSKNIQITPYTSNLRYPLILETTLENEYFANLEERCVDIENPLFNELQSDKTRNLINSYVIPNAIFEKMPPYIQNKIITTESYFSDSNIQSQNERYEQAKIIANNYLVILEASIRDLVFDKFYSKIDHKDFSFMGSQIKDYSVSLGKTEGKNFTLGSLKHLVARDLKELRLKAKDLLLEIQDINGILQRNELVDIRNSESHLDGIEKQMKMLEEIRRIVLGVGHPGLLNKLYFAVYKEHVQEELLMKEVA